MLSKLTMLSKLLISGPRTLALFTVASTFHNGRCQLFDSALCRTDSGLDVFGIKQVVTALLFIRPNFHARAFRVAS